MSTRTHNANALPPIQAIFAGTASSALGQRIASELGQPLSHLHVKRFSDGELHVQLGEDITNKHICIVQATYPPAEHMTELLLTIDAAQHAQHITIVIPYLGYMRQDHTHHERSSVGARLHATLLNTMPISRLITCDLHTPHILDLLDCPVHHIPSTTTFLPYIQQLPHQALTFIAPDTGSIDRVRPYAQYFNAPLIHCTKKRNKNQQTITTQIHGHVRNTHAIIIDDIIDTAATIATTAQQLRQQGANTIHALCTHALFSEGAHQRIAQAKLNTLLVSDTIPLKTPSKNMEICSIAPSIAQVLRQG